VERVEAQAAVSVPELEPEDQAAQEPVAVLAEEVGLAPLLPAQ